MKTYHLAVLPADGVGPEVIAAGRTVLDRLARQHGGVAFQVQELDWGSNLGEAELAARLMHAIETVLREGKVRTRDLGGTSSTQEMTDAVCRAAEARAAKAA